ncbi:MULTISPECIES: cytochrome o ubiquinol oxidase subunit IV [Comamonas]|jgi:cytochrome o ubiquinol oxidase operon protein cyoD|uniref:Cytochrome bo(3) ubiquinol oxidase subunit 4 n=2 Tax=Comamonas aquatica TaxID=225991 RepID=A0A014MC89_9BURK|nr:MULTISPECIES: cytochrome o ubiquinol oxidase subunit IV [Comamonas]ANY63442.1 cytochrome o ubiquinol oxidase subunit IV [Comamonas aquatica]EXU79371.1 cytochrome C oxidase subunit III [Comamonas aquatica DA1877]MDH0200252.1 cytochrome o ubiquinol oxidase subunit IV [Comamonas aquatica]MDH0361876.1 cytochrome o ubiquinol oxidase subunit IV [Comamonas aquatica]MDH0380899.1 cytochrome o ubiquinol oxidase subunit IV [Comamonas aquatica]
MSAHDLHAGHDDHHGEEEIHVTTGGYVTGFILAVILTVIPFWLVMAKVIDNRATAAMVLGLFAAVQVVVHMYFFLHMNGKIQGGWTMLSTIFSVVFVAITLAGTLWVMFHMNTNMMPSHTDLPPVDQPAVAAPAPAAVQPAAEPAAAHSGHSSN